MIEIDKCKDCKGHYLHICYCCKNGELFNEIDETWIAKALKNVFFYSQWDDGDVSYLKIKFPNLSKKMELVL